MASYYANNSSFRRSHRGEDVDPMSSLANLSDAMLVFATGLLMALVVAYNVDLGVSQVAIDESNDVTDEISSIQGTEEGGSSYVQRGTVYEDPKTGRLYLYEEGTDSSDASGSSDTATSSSGQ